MKRLITLGLVGMLNACHPFMMIQAANRDKIEQTQPVAEYFGAFYSVKDDMKAIVGFRKNPNGVVTANIDVYEGIETEESIFNGARPWEEYECRGFEHDGRFQPMCSDVPEYARKFVEGHALSRQLHYEDRLGE